MTYSTADTTSKAIRIAVSPEDIQGARSTESAEELFRQALLLLRWLPARKLDAVAEDYEQRVAEDRPYESTVDAEEFRKRYGV